VRARLNRFLDLGLAPGDDPDLRVRKRTSHVTLVVETMGEDR